MPWPERPRISSWREAAQALGRWKSPARWPLRRPPRHAAPERWSSLWNSRSRQISAPGLENPLETASFFVKREENAMSDEQTVPETRGVAAEVLATVDLGPEIEGMAGRQLRMRMFTFEPEASSARFTTTRTGRGSSTSCRARSPTIETEPPRTTGREWVGPRTGTPGTGSRTGERSRRWRSRSTSSGASKGSGLADASCGFSP